MRITLLSDIHLEHRPLVLAQLLAPDAIRTNDIICLAGDIGDPFSLTYASFLHECAAAFKYVFVIAGNHEYYHHTIADTEYAISTVCSRYPNAFFMNNRTITVDDITFIGTTLWSHIPDANAPAVAAQMNDYHLIYLSPQHRITPATVNAAFANNLKFLEGAINEARSTNKKAIVMTHHCPTTHMTSSRTHHGSPINCAFATELSHAIKPAYISAWFCGHTHHNFRFTINGVPIASNQYGSHNTPLPRFDPNFTFTI